MLNKIMIVCATLFSIPAFALDPNAVPVDQANYWNHIVCHGTPSSGSSNTDDWKFEIYWNYRSISETSTTETYSAMVAETRQLNSANRPTVNSGGLLSLNKDDKSLSRLYYNEYSWEDQGVDPASLPENELYYEGYEIIFSAPNKGRAHKWFEYIEAETGNKKRSDWYLDVKCLKM